MRLTNPKNLVIFEVDYGLAWDLDLVLGNELLGVSYRMSVLRWQ